jgi:hypothetical protein
MPADRLKTRAAAVVSTFLREDSMPVISLASVLRVGLCLAIGLQLSQTL